MYNVLIYLVAVGAVRDIDETLYERRPKSPFRANYRHNSPIQWSRGDTRQLARPMRRSLLYVRRCAGDLLPVAGPVMRAGERRRVYVTRRWCWTYDPPPLILYYPLSVYKLSLSCLFNLYCFLEIIYADCAKLRAALAWVK